MLGPAMIITIFNYLFYCQGKSFLATSRHYFLALLFLLGQKNRGGAARRRTISTKHFRRRCAPYVAHIFPGGAQSSDGRKHAHLCTSFNLLAAYNCGSAELTQFVNNYNYIQAGMAQTKEKCPLSSEAMGLGWPPPSLST